MAHFLNNHIRFGTTEKESELVTALTDLTVLEVSVVDRPANNRPWLVKQADEATSDDGVIIVDANASPATKTAEFCEKTWNALGTLEKALDINDLARNKVFSHIDEVGYRMDDLLGLLMAAQGSPFSGSLDTAVGGELASIGQIFMKMAEGFGVTEAPAEMDPEGVMMAAEKAGRAMSRSRMRKLAETAMAGHSLAQMLMTLFRDVGGNDDMLSELVEHASKGELEQTEKAETLNTIIIDEVALKSHFDDRLSTVIQAMAASHSGLIQRFDDLNQPVEVTIDDSTIQKSAPQSNQLSSNPFQPVNSRSGQDSETNPSRGEAANPKVLLSEHLAERFNLGEDS